MPYKFFFVKGELFQMSKKYFTSQNARTLIQVYGLAIFPTHGVDDDGRCTCGVDNCGSPGKHPATKDGFKSATKDIDQLLRLWDGRKFLNVGIETGEKSNIFVIDIDSAEGEKNLRALGALPDTLSVSTGKGRHLYFAYPGEPVITKRGILPGVDVRGDGGYVCGPGSNHISGTKYEWINDLEAVQVAPDFILDLVVKSRIRTDKPAPTLNISQPSGRLHIHDKRTVDDLRDHLSYISPDVGYDDWINVGMAIHDSGFSFDEWNNWSMGGVKYNAHEMQAHWKSFKSGGGRSYGTIFYMAQQGGWEPKRGAQAPVFDKPSESYDPETGEINDDDSSTDGAEKTDKTDETYEWSKKAENPGNKPRRRLPLLYADDLSAVTDTADFVENLLCENQFSVIYGESNCGKTFFMMDLAMHVALGRDWRGREVEQGGVIYAALEGGQNTRNRVVAFRKHYGVTDPIPLAIIPSSLNLLDPEGDIHSLVESIWEAKERIGNIKMVIIDTLSRAMSGGDENSSMDMGQLIINADAIRAVTGAHISFVHHCGKDAVKGARGHSSLRAAVDTEIEISRDDDKSPSKIKVVKQREMETGDELFFGLSSVELGTNQRGKPITSCVVLPADVVEELNRKKMTSHEKFVYNAILNCLITNGEGREVFRGSPIIKSIDYHQLAETLEAAGYKNLFKEDGTHTANQATLAARMSLKDKGYINFNRTFIWISEEG
jgi:hypothetical protein